MKLSESVVTALITILGILPFIWFTYIGRKGATKSKKIINDLIKGEGLNFNEKELWNHNFIGIDESRNSLLFVKVKSDGNEVTKVDLNHLKACQIHKNTRDYKREKKMESELQTLNLEFTFDSIQPNVILNFYDIEDHLSEEFEMKRAEKWQQSILKNSHKTTVKSTAA